MSAAVAATARPASRWRPGFLSTRKGMFGFVVLPITFLGGTYYQWTRLAPVKVHGFPWLQTLVLVNPLMYVNEGFRAAVTNADHMHLYIVYPALLLCCALFLTLGIRGFRKRVLT